MNYSKMKEGEPITFMLDRFSAIMNGLASRGRHIDDSEKVKNILRSLPQEWDSQVTAIIKSKDLNTLDFNALVGSFIDYEIILKTRGGRPKPKKKSVAFKAKASLKEESDEKDEKLPLYAKNMRKIKSMMLRRKREIKKGPRDDVRRTSNYMKRNDHNCYNCGTCGIM